MVNLDEILKLKLLDIIYVGPFDLTISYGKSPDILFKSNQMKKTYKDILWKVKKAGKIAAIHCISARNSYLFF